MKIIFSILAFTSLMLSSGCGANTQACDMAKGKVIESCVNMQIGAVGMQKCSDATNQANAACGRADLTPVSILQEAMSKK